MMSIVQLEMCCVSEANRLCCRKFELWFRFVYLLVQLMSFFSEPAIYTVFIYPPSIIASFHTNSPSFSLLGLSSIRPLTP
ncbi:hypothetical protein M440DRAFT_267846 [Trichoderma longibrachiatum ATCC 18648]|uniref:Uncharacterized protein n=1 Tax=Trichoderma longibrachiatum ATCC 18648 TaxID=983965 RepID=A0A2T4CAU4_TRILO|nr:hypothetical protein M440DRAFT_267846 [Trichoderma longibrachiatum ATCC 18648]